MTLNVIVTWDKFTNDLTTCLILLQYRMYGIMVLIIQSPGTDGVHRKPQVEC